MIALDAGGPEDGHFSVMAEWGENLEGVAQLFKRCAQQFDIAAIGVVAEQLVGRFLDLLDELLVSNWPSFFVVGLLVVYLLKRIGAFSGSLVHYCVSGSGFFVRC